MSDEKNLQYFVWQATEWFFIISLILFVYLFFVKGYINKESKHRKKFKLSLDNYLDELESLKEPYLIPYAHGVGELLLNVNENERKVIERELNKRDVYQRVYHLYEKKVFYFSKLYILSSLAMLENPKIRTLCFSILNNKKLINKIPEFNVIAIKGIALSNKNEKHLLELYNILNIMREDYNTTREFAKLFFTESISLLKSDTIVKFIKKLQFESISATTYAFIDAVLFLSKNRDIYEALINLRDTHKEGYKLNSYIYKIEQKWNIRTISSIKNHNIKINKNNKCNRCEISYCMLDDKNILNRNLLLSNNTIYSKKNKAI